MVEGLVVLIVLLIVAVIASVSNLPFILLNRNITSGTGLGCFGQEGLRESGKNETLNRQRYKYVCTLTFCF